jgi:hypothetical protein
MHIGALLISVIHLCSTEQTCEMNAENRPADAPTMKVAVIGATGGIGSQVARLAHERGWHVIACSRDPSRAVQYASDRWDNVKVDLADPGAEDVLADGVRGADFVFSCIGTSRGESTIVSRGTRTILAAMGKSGVPRVSMISSVGIGDSEPQLRRSGFSGWLVSAVLSTFLRRVKTDLTQAEEVAIGKKHARPDGVSCVVVRPGGLSWAPAQGKYEVAGADGTIGMSVRQSLNASPADHPAWLQRLTRPPLRVVPVCPLRCHARMWPLSCSRSPQTGSTTTAPSLLGGMRRASTARSDEGRLGRAHFTRRGGPRTTDFSPVPIDWKKFYKPRSFKEEV